MNPESCHRDSSRADQSVVKSIQEVISVVESYTVALVAVQNERVVHDRTGVLYRIGDRHFILTTSHVGSGGDHDLRAILRNEIPHYVALNVPGILPIPLTAPATLHGTEVDGRDIAAIVLPRDVADRISSYKRFISSNQVLTHDHGRSGFYAIVGYPQDWSCRRFTEEFLYSKPLVYLCNHYTGEVDPRSAYSRDIHLVLEFERDAYDVTDGTKLALPKPHGISGCGVWRIADRSGEGLKEVSKDNVSLVALQKSWHRARKYVMATRIKWVLARILDDYPELERPMALAYPKTLPSQIVVPARCNLS